MASSGHGGELHIRTAASNMEYTTAMQIVLGAFLEKFVGHELDPEFDNNDPAVLTPLEPAGLVSASFS